MWGLHGIVHSVSPVHRDVTDEYFKQLADPWGVPVFVYHRRDNMHHLETRSKKVS